MVIPAEPDAVIFQWPWALVWVWPRTSPLARCSVTRRVGTHAWLGEVTVPLNVRLWLLIEICDAILTTCEASALVAPRTAAAARTPAPTLATLAALSVISA